MGLAVSAILPVSALRTIPISRTLEVYSRSRARGEVIRANEDRFDRYTVPSFGYAGRSVRGRSNDGSIGGIIFCEESPSFRSPRRRFLRLNADLETRVSSATAQLVEARGRAEAANAAKSAFLANMSP